MQKINKLELLKSVVAIHLRASEFYLNAYDRQPTAENLKMFLHIQREINRHIGEAVDG